MAEPAPTYLDVQTTTRPLPVRDVGDVLVALGPLRIERAGRMRSLTLTVEPGAPAELHEALERCRLVRARVGGFAGLVVFREGLAPGSYAIHSRLETHAGQIPELDWPLERRLELFVRVARSVQGLHEVGEVMGALSPKHVLLNSGELPHVLGPGVRVEEASAYEAPELREEGRQDMTSDIFALGALLHFLVSDEAPEQVAAHGELPAFACVSHRGLRRIARKACAPRPEQRYENVYELLFDLARRGDADGVGLAHPTDPLRGEESGARRLVDALTTGAVAAE